MLANDFTGATSSVIIILHRLGLVNSQSFTFISLNVIIAAMNEQLPLVQDPAVKKLVKQLEKSERAVNRLQRRNDSLNKKLAKQEREIERLQKLLDTKGIEYAPPVRKVIKRYPEVWEEYQGVVHEFNWRTFNLKTVAQAILRILEGDENGVIELTPEELRDYLRSVREYGPQRWAANFELRWWTPQTDSLSLFKSCGYIDRILHKQDYYSPWKPVTNNGEPVNHPYLTRSCSEEDLLLPRQQQAEHPNNYCAIEDFIGDDRLRELRRRAEFNIPNRSYVPVHRRNPNYDSSPTAGAATESN